MAQTASVKKSSDKNNSSKTTAKKTTATPIKSGTVKKSSTSSSQTKSTTRTNENKDKKNTSTSNSTKKPTTKSSSTGNTVKKDFAKSNVTKNTSVKNNSNKNSGVKASANKNTVNKNTSIKNNVNKKIKEKKEKHSVWEEYDFPVIREVIRWMLVAFSIILFISSFEQIGENLIWLKKINFGLFGWFGYASVLFLLYLAFGVVPEIGRAKAWIRFISILIVTASVCGVMQIFVQTPLNIETTFAQYYEMGYEQGGGGILAGVMVKLLYPWLGTVGMTIILVTFIICGVIVMSEHSGIQFLQNITTSFCESIMRAVTNHRMESDLKKAERQRLKEIKKQEKAERKARQEESYEDDSDEDEYDEEEYDNEEYDEEEYDEEEYDEDDSDEEAEWKRLEEEAKQYANYDSDEYVDYLEEQDLEENRQQDDAYVKNEVEKIRKRMTRKNEIEKQSEQNLMEWNDTTANTQNHNPADLYEKRDKYSNTLGDDDARLVASTTRTVVTSSGKVITRESDEIPPAVTKHKINKKNVETIEENKNEEKEEYIPPKPYCFPTIDLLNVGDKKFNGKNQEKELRETAEILEQTFRDFGVGVTVTNYSCGPTVTRYELEPDNGVKVSRVTALTDDIKLKLAATDLRIEAPIPGKAAIGIEVPNKENSTVMFRDLVESDAFQRHPSKLAFAVGKDIAGKVIVFDIAKMPHVLIAGATGSGKSVCINTLIMSILYKADPSEVKLIMVDPKVVELGVYNDIPHLLIPVVTDPKKAAGALNWAVAEMTRRYQLFAETVTRDLAGYNRKARGIRAELEKEGLTLDKIEQEGPEILPQIVIIVDEFADLMMVAPNEVEDAICRLAQLARAAGIHLVLATQRPSVNVITGLIKANVPSRIAFSVSSGVDSRTILDMNGAEKLLGKGDMLFAPFGCTKPVRVQGAFISETEVIAVTDFIKKENSTFVKEEKKAKVDLSVTSEEAREEENERDEYFEKAGFFLIEKEKGSIGMLQRMFKIGFNRAARIMEQLAEAGVVGPEEGTKPRKILMTKEEFEEFIKNN